MRGKQLVVLDVAVGDKILVDGRPFRVEEVSGSALAIWPWGWRDRVRRWWGRRGF